MTERKSALITGISGQDGSYLAELLLEKGYEVHGMVRADGDLGCSEHLRERIALVEGDLLSPPSLTAAVGEVRPDELYHLAAPSFVPASWRRPAETLQAIAGSAATLIEAVRDESPPTRLFIASSSAMFGDAPHSPQREDTPCRPQNPYAAAKLAAHQLAGLARVHDGVWVSCGILYNHESSRRPEQFVTRKVTLAAARIKLGLADHVKLGDLQAVRDWSFAGDVMRGAWLALQGEQADDYIFASGRAHTVAQLAQIAFAHAGLDAERYIHVDPELQRGVEPTPLVGDPTRARERLGWEPTLSFEQLIAQMVDADLRALSGIRR